MPSTSTFTIWICLYPSYVKIGSAAASSPTLFRLLRERGVRLESWHWSGDLDDLPEDEPCLVRASSVLHYPWRDLARRCEQLGHLLFYDDALITADGGQDERNLLAVTELFLERCRTVFAPLSPSKETEMKTWTLNEIVTSLVEDQAEIVWIETTGKEYLERQTSLTKAEWDELLRRSFNLVREYGVGKVAVLYRLVVARGIRDLEAYIRARSLDEKGPDVRDWWTSLLYQVQPVRFGIGSDLCTRQEAIELLEAMKAVAQLLKSDWFLEEIAAYRVPGDHEMAKVLAASWKNW